jgi:hypothetical protein
MTAAVFLFGRAAASSLEGRHFATTLTATQTLASTDRRFVIKSLNYF